MSEHYDFHYQPTGSGAISGQQVLQQTEDAINELGDYVNDNVGGAMDVAQQALETAQNAKQDAQTALDTANSFSDAIQSAQQDASTALSTAQTAQTMVTNAYNTAIQAQQDANTAVTTANNASGQVSTLSGTVTTLGQRVTTAEGNIGQNTSDITALTTRVGTAEGNITTLQNDVTIAQGNASSAMATAGQVKQQAFVFRYSSTALTASSTNSNTLLDNTDNLKVGDKVIDSSGVLFSITAIDTVNSTFTIGTALIDLAQDSDVVHKSGDETIAGFKEFANIRATNSIKGINLDSTTTDLNNCYSVFASSDGTRAGNIQYYYCNTDAGTANISNLPEAKAFVLTSITTKLISNSLYVKQILINSISKTFVRYCNNSTWSSWVNETDSEYVHKSGDETISGNKTFSSINGVEPSSLSLPSDRSARIDISSYFTDTSNGGVNRYTAPSNGFVYLFVTDVVSMHILSQTSGGLTNYGDTKGRNSVGQLYAFLPVRKDDVFTSQWYTTLTNVSLSSAYFIPCQGNV